MLCQELNEMDIRDAALASVGMAPPRQLAMGGTMMVILPQGGGPAMAPPMSYHVVGQPAGTAAVMYVQPQSGGYATQFPQGYGGPYPAAYGGQYYTSGAVMAGPGTSSSTTTVTTPGGGTVITNNNNAAGGGYYTLTGGVVTGAPVAVPSYAYGGAPYDSGSAGPVYVPQGQQFQVQVAPPTQSQWAPVPHSGDHAAAASAAAASQPKYV